MSDSRGQQINDAAFKGPSGCLNSSRDVVMGFVKCLADVSEIHLDEIRGHGSRVAALSAKLARVGGLSERDVDVIEASGWLHDLGAVAIPPQIMLKGEETLTKRQQAIIEKHPLIGHNLIRGVSGMEEVARVVLHHHEWFSGGGYPRGLAGDRIPVGARVIAVIDFFDAHVNPADTRSSMPVEAVIDALRDGSKTRFDPYWVDLFDENLDDIEDGSSYQHVELPLRQLKPGMTLARDIRSLDDTVLLKSGTSLSSETIERLSGNELFDELMSRIVVNRESLVRSHPFERKAPSKAVDGADGSEESQDKRAPSSGSAKKTVIAVDDETKILNAIRRELRGTGYVVETYDNARQALLRLKDKSTSIYALLTDFNMPGMTGDQFIHQAQELHPSLPCVVITGLATKETVRKLVNAGKITRVLPKPWNKDVLLKTLDELPSNSLR